MDTLPLRSRGVLNFVTLRRNLTNHVVTGVAIISTILVLVPLVAIFGYLLYKGASSLNLAFFTHVPVPVGEAGGGMANAIAGSGVILGLASLLGIPVGIGAGVYLAEYARGTWLGAAVRFTADVLNGVPSIGLGRVCPDRRQATAFFRYGRKRGAGHHDDPYGHADYRRDARHGAESGARGGPGPGHPQVAHRAFGQLANRVARNYYRLHAGFCACGRRDGTAAVHGLRKPVLEL